MRIAALVGAVSVIVVLGTPAGAGAQNTAAGEIAGGYQLTRGWRSGDSESDGEVRPAGWFVSGGARLIDSVSLIGEVSGTHFSPSIIIIGPEGPEDFELGWYTFVGGLRISVPGTVRPFVQFQAGARRTTVTFSRGPGIGHTDFIMQPGGGIDLRLTNTIAARVMIDFRRLPTVDGVRNHEIRVAAGVVIALGSR